MSACTSSIHLAARRGLTIQGRMASRQTLATSSSSSNVASAFDSAAAFDEKHPLFTSTPFHRPPVVPHDISPRRHVPSHICFPPYAKTGRVPSNRYPDRIYLHNDSSIKRMRNAAMLARKVLDMACSLAKVGVTTDSIDEAVHHAIIAHGAYPSPLNYHGFPKSLCASVNEVICHGIPDARPLQEGDVVSFDVSCFVNGVHGDNCATVIVGDEQDNVGSAGTDWRGVPYKMEFESQEQEIRFAAARRLVHATRESLYAAIEECRPGGCLTRVGHAIHQVADAYGYDTVQKYRGHGISHEFHCMPYVKHYRNNDMLELSPGMIFTIEPMLTEGQSDCTEWDDEWTVVTVDGGLAAQFEHTVLITESGVEILTLPPE